MASFGYSSTVCSGGGDDAGLEWGVVATDHFKHFPSSSYWPTPVVMGGLRTPLLPNQWLSTIFFKAVNPFDLIFYSDRLPWPLGV